LGAQEGEDNPALLRKIADANRRIGAIHQRLGQFEESREAYGRALDLWGQLREDADDTTAIDVEVAQIHIEMGRSFVAQDRPEEGRAAFSRALAGLEGAIVSDEASSQVTFTLARALLSLGQAPRPPIPPMEGRGGPPGGRRGWRRNGDGPDADSGARPGGRGHRRDRSPETPKGDADYVRRAVDLLTRLVELHPEMPDYRHLLALCYRELSRPETAAPKNGDTGGTDRAIELLEGLVAEHPEAAQYRFDLAETLATGMAAPHSIDDKHIVEVEAPLQQAKEIAEALVAEHPNMPTYALLLAQTHHRLADVLWRQDKIGPAEQSLRRAVALQTGLAEQFPEVLSYRVAAALYRSALGRFLLRDYRPSEAAEYIQAAIADLQEIGDGESVPSYVQNLSRRCQRLLSHVQERIEQGPEREDRRGEGGRRRPRGRPHQPPPREPQQQ
jgi:tetratricopeptide (TPR) repeat protein